MTRYNIIMAKRREFSYDADSIIVSRPTYIIEVIIAGLSFVLGTYLCSPLYMPPPNNKANNTFSQSQTLRFVVAFGLLLLPSIISFLSLHYWKFKSNFWRRRATFFLFCAWIFLGVLQLTNSGFYPITWIITLTIGAIAGVCHFSTVAADEVK